MKGRLYHICYTSHQEVICRKHADYVRLFNCIAQATINTGSILVTYSIMSNHVHLAVVADDAGRLVQRIRSSYTQMFNDVYRRTGMLGDQGYYRLHLAGRLHVAAALSYILRNPVHHRVCANPYAYQYSPILLYFNYPGTSLPDTGRQAGRNVSCARSRKAIRRNNYVPDNIPFDRFGMMDVASVVSTDVLEGYFGSYRAFQYGLSRGDYDRWKEEQESDSEGAPPVTISSIEPYLSQEAAENMTLRNMSWFRDAGLSDMELCSLIDGQYLSDFNRRTYTELTDAEKMRIAGCILNEYARVSVQQLGRCLCISPDALL